MPDSLQSSWRTVKLGNVVTLSRGKDLPVQNRMDGQYPVIGSNGIVGHHAERVGMGPGVLVGRSGSVGQVMYVEKDFWPLNTTLWVTNFHGNDPRFIAFFLRHLNLGRFTGGVSVPTLNRNVVHRLDVRLPPIGEQKRISEVLKAAECAITTRERELETHRELFDVLLQGLLTEKLVFTSRNYESLVE